MKINKKKQFMHLKCGNECIELYKKSYFCDFCKIYIHEDLNKYIKVAIK